NCDPDDVDYPIPGNDDAIRSVTLLTRVVADAVAEGLMARAGAKADEPGAELGAEEPLAEWERELYAAEGAAAAAATGADSQPAGSETGEGAATSEAADATPAEPASGEAASEPADVKAGQGA